jgi:hypothetical protein
MERASTYVFTVTDGLTHIEEYENLFSNVIFTIHFHKSNKTDHHDITDILLKVALDTIKTNKQTNKQYL